MFFPKQCRRKTEWTSAGCIEQQHKVGNEYINAYIPAISSTLKCNHDVKFLGAGEGTETTNSIIVIKSLMGAVVGIRSIQELLHDEVLYEAPKRYRKPSSTSLTRI
ncbi:hypothetical protein PHMEG_00037668 [Phytophthora megakarya]|uniref:Uncharacterized protein n=1 Tax=Phytophthora megakarya TaxID=4795 RepID=A0A225ULP8_9STRA|nr:hypothetical protein PHMEG_00037668 [Phytophthora megakarya]